MPPFPNPMCSSSQGVPTPTWRFNASDTMGGVSGDGLSLGYLAGAYAASRSTRGDPGKFYFEVRETALPVSAGVSFLSTPLGAPGGANGAGWAATGAVAVNGVGVATYATYGTSDILGFAVDAVGGRIWFSKNGVWQAGDPGAGTGGLPINVGTYYPHVRVDAGGVAAIPTPLSYPIPQGFGAL